MAELLHSISVMSDGSIRNTSESTPLFYRVLHDIERGPLWRFRLPEVYRLTPDHVVPFGRELQLLSKAINPAMDGRKWRSLYAFNRAFTNNTGFDEPGDPRADYINGVDLDSKDPAFDTVRICGGAMLQGTERDGMLWISNYIDMTKPLPTAAQVLAEHRYFVATTVHDDGSVGDFPQGGGAPVLVPLVARQPICYPVKWLERCDGTQSPYYVRK